MSGRLMNSQLMSVLGFSSAQFDESLQQCLDAALSSKKFLQACQARFDEAFGQGHDAADLVRARASLVDQFVMALWQRQDGDVSQRICLLAVGGYGRGELHPHSDVDLLILLAKAPSKKNKDGDDLKKV